MELYHIHILGNHDEKYKPNNELIIDGNYNNNLYNMVVNAKYMVPAIDFKDLIVKMNIDVVENQVNLYDIVNEVSKYGTKEEKEKLLKYLHDVKDYSRVAQRELALEEYRKKYANDKPSRLHSLYAYKDNVEGYYYWLTNLSYTKADIYLIDVLDIPFKTNAGLLPIETLRSQDLNADCAVYFNPESSNKFIMPETTEYLIQGKVKILEKVEEIR